MNIEINERFTAYYLIFMETDLKRKHQTHILGSYKVFHKWHCGLTKMVLKTCISYIYISISIYIYIYLSIYLSTELPDKLGYHDSENKTKTKQKCITVYKEMQTPLPKQERGHTIGGT